MNWSRDTLNSDFLEKGLEIVVHHITRYLTSRKDKNFTLCFDFK